MERQYSSTAAFENWQSELMKKVKPKRRKSAALLQRNQFWSAALFRRFGILYSAGP